MPPGKFRNLYIPDLICICEENFKCKKVFKICMMDVEAAGFLICFYTFLFILVICEKLTFYVMCIFSISPHSLHAESAFRLLGGGHW